MRMRAESDLEVTINRAYKWPIICKFRHDPDEKFKCNYGVNQIKIKINENNYK